MVLDRYFLSFRQLSVCRRVTIADFMKRIAAYASRLLVAVRIVISQQGQALWGAALTILEDHSVRLSFSRYLRAVDTTPDSPCARPICLQDLAAIHHMKEQHNGTTVDMCRFTDYNRVRLSKAA